jgi:hypothetical protein
MWLTLAPATVNSSGQVAKYRRLPQLFYKFQQIMVFFAKKETPDPITGLAF